MFLVGNINHIDGGVGCNVDSDPDYGLRSKNESDNYYLYKLV